MASSECHETFHLSDPNKEELTLLIFSFMFDISESGFLDE